MTDDDRLRAELEALERAAPISDLPIIEAARPRPLGRIGLVGATVVAAIALTSFAFGLGRSLDVGSRSSSPDPSGPPANPPAVAETRVGDFILTISSPKTMWTTEESIEVSAALTYVGSEPSMTIGQGVPPLGFALRNASGEGPTLTGMQEQPCLMYQVSADEPLIEDYQKGVPIAADGRPVDAAPPFDREFLDDAALRLPAGEWAFTAMTSFDERDCGDDYQLDVSIILRVIEPSSATQQPSTDTTPVPSNPEPSSTPEMRACMTALASGVLGSGAEGDPVLIVDDGLPPVSIVFSYPEDFVIETTPILTIYDRDRNVLARESDEVELGGGFGPEDTVFFACAIHQVKEVGAAVQCGLPGEECDAALTAFGELFEVDDPGLAMLAIRIGRGLRWHAEVHACWLDGRYVLVDVRGDANRPTDDPIASVRPEGWDDPPCAPDVVAAPGPSLPSDEVGHHALPRVLLLPPCAAGSGTAYGPIDAIEKSFIGFGPCVGGDPSQPLRW